MQVIIISTQAMQKFLDFSYRSLKERSNASQQTFISMKHVIYYWRDFIYYSVLNWNIYPIFSFI